MTSTVSRSTVSVNEAVDAMMDATDTGHRFGYEDATEGRDQAGSVYFAPGTPAWNAYNQGYRQGCIHSAVLTGQSRTYWMPVVADVSWASRPVMAVGDVDYVPFQCPELYNDVLFDDQRDDYVGD